MVGPKCRRLSHSASVTTSFCVVVTKSCSPIAILPPIPDQREGCMHPNGSWPNRHTPSSAPTEVGDCAVLPFKATEPHNPARCPRRHGMHFQVEALGSACLPASPAEAGHARDRSFARDPVRSEHQLLQGPWSAGVQYLTPTTLPRRDLRPIDDHRLDGAARGTQTAAAQRARRQ